jgi:hypothetical protein
VKDLVMVLHCEREAKDVAGRNSLSEVWKCEGWGSGDEIGSVGFTRGKCPAECMQQVSLTARHSFKFSAETLLTKSPDFKLSRLACEIKTRSDSSSNESASQCCTTGYCSSL